MQKPALYLGVAIVAILFVLLFVIDYPDSSFDSEGFNESFGPAKRAGSLLFLDVATKSPQNVSLLSYSTKPSRDLSVLEQSGIGDERFEEFFTLLSTLESKGFSVRRVRTVTAGRGELLIVPSGAMPESLVDNPELWRNRYIYYVGRTDIAIRNGIKNEPWYDNLEDWQKERIIIAGPDLEEVWENRSNLLRDIEVQEWILEDSRTATVLGNTTLYVATNGTFARILTPGLASDYHLPVQMIDLGVIELKPGQKKILLFPINRTAGTAHFTISRNGQNLSSKELGRIVESQVLEESLEFEESGVYVISIRDSSGMLGGGVVHIPSISFDRTQKLGRIVRYAVTEDGLPYDGEVSVQLNNGTPKTYYSSQGELSLEIKFKEGTNSLTLIAKGNREVQTVDHGDDSFVAPFIRIGIPGLVVVAIVYGFTRMTKKPIYLIRVPDHVRELRKNLVMTRRQFSDIFKRTQKDLSLDAPLSLQEIIIGLKKYHTLGAEVTEGNVEGLLVALEKEGIIVSCKGHYLLAPAPLMARKTMVRLVRDLLIERGIDCVATNESIKTKHMRIIFSLSTLKDIPSILLFEDSNARNEFVGSLTDQDRAHLRLKERNGLVKLTTLDQFEASL